MPRVGALLLVLAPLGACASTHAAAHKAPDAFTIEKLANDVVRLHLEPRAVERIQLRTEAVAAAVGGATTASRSLPYAALLYSPDGSTFVYTNPEANTYVRYPVAVEQTDGRSAVVSNGPAEGTPVVTDGAAELMGIEFGVGK